MSASVFIFLFFLVALGSAMYLPLGILVWVWLTLQTPQQVMGVLWPFNLIIVLCCMLACLSQIKNARSPLSGLVYILLLYLFHTTLTTFFGVMPEQSFSIWDRFWKTVALVLFIVTFMHNRARLHAVVVVVVISLGFLAAKGAVFTILTGGGFRVQGPVMSQISDNNHFGAALSMIFPLAGYTVLVSKNKITKLSFLGAALMIPVAAIFTYSRGAVVALSAIVTAYWTLSRHKVRIAVAAVLFITVALPAMPESWSARMMTIGESGDRDTADGSVQGRFDSWEAHWEMALRRPLLGGGFRSIEMPQIWATVSASPIARAAHNSYFQTLGEHGFLGLILYLVLIFATLLNAYRIRRATRYFPELAWARSLATAAFLSTLSYLVSSVTLSLATFDLFYIIMAIIICLQRITMDHLERAKS